MNSVNKFVICGWGIEFGRYYCGGAPARFIPDGHGGTEQPAVPVSWFWGFGVHYRTRWNKTIPPTKECPWVWARRWWYGKEHPVKTVAGLLLARTYLDGVAEFMNKEWNQ